MTIRSAPAAHISPLVRQSTDGEGPSPEVSIVMPCLNEAETLATCIRKAKQALWEQEIDGEVIVADNGSTDGSQAIALREGARLVEVTARGYGNALIGGITAARGRYVIMGDADDSYDFLDVPSFVVKLREGYDLVMGNRFKGGIKPGAMPLLHRYLGNPVLSAMGRLFFASPCGDFHCGLRGFSKEAIRKMELRTTGMEFASEMVVKATVFKMRITEVPTMLSPDGRSRSPHLRSWRDGWRHLRFLLLYSPRWLFLNPGIILMVTGLIIGIWLFPGPRTVRGVTFDVATLLYAMAAIFIGFQSVLFAIFTKTFAICEGLHPKESSLNKWYRFFTLEKGLLTGAVLTIIGLFGSVYSLNDWGSHLFGPLDPARTLRVVIPSILSLILGLQTSLSSFFLSVLGMGRK